MPEPIKTQMPEWVVNAREAIVGLPPGCLKCEIDQAILTAYQDGEEHNNLVVYQNFADEIETSILKLNGVERVPVELNSGDIAQLAGLAKAEEKTPIKPDSTSAERIAERIRTRYSYGTPTHKEITNIVREELKREPPLCPDCDGYLTCNICGT